MAVLVAVVLLVQLLVVGVGAAVVVSARRRLFRRRVLVVTVDGQTIEGVLLSRRGGLLELRDAGLQGPSGLVAVDGVMFVERARVAWVQVS